MIEKLISGGQTGADRAALDVAIFQENGIKRLNVAGSRESTGTGLHAWTMAVLEDALFCGDNHPGMLGGPAEG